MFYRKFQHYDSMIPVLKCINVARCKCVNFLHHLVDTQNSMTGFPTCCVGVLPLRAVLTTSHGGSHYPNNKPGTG